MDVVLPFLAFELRSHHESLPVVVPSLRNFRPDGDAVLQGRAEGAGSIYVAQNLIVAHRDDGFDVGLMAAVNDVLVGKQMGGWNGNRPDFVQGYHRNPPFDAALQDQHDAIAALNA